MTTLAKDMQSDFAKVTPRAAAVRRPSAYDRFIEQLHFSYFGLIAMAILIGSCLGGITTMKIFEADAGMWQFVLGLGVTMANLVASISQAPTKWVVNLFALSLLVNTVLLLVNL